MNNETMVNKSLNYSSSIGWTSFGGKIRIVGSLITFLFDIFFSNDNNKDGNNNKFETIANNKVTETNPPKAIVPPKLETVKTKNPKNNTIDV